MDILAILKGGLVASIQPVDDGPMDHPEIVAAMALAAIAGGASGLRIEGVDNLAAVRSRVDMPIIGIVKRDLADSPVRITPLIEDVRALARAGANVIALDATSRHRPVPLSDLVAAARAEGALVMADCSSFADAVAARKLGVDVIGTTLSGYTAETDHGYSFPDLDLLRQMRRLGGFVMAEGRYNSPELAAAAIRAGADAVTVGSALTRLEHVTSWFDHAIREALS